MKPAIQKLKRLLLAPFVWLAAIIFLVEEAIWDWTAAVMARLGAVRAVHAVERRIAALRPRWAFFAFILPSAILIPAKLFGLHAITTGHWLLGSAIFITFAASWADSGGCPGCAGRSLKRLMGPMNSVPKTDL